ncbi:MAG: hypothetical protein R2755_12675 [Acidimicrobiales bacterium]
MLDLTDRLPPGGADRAPTCWPAAARTWWSSWRGAGRIVVDAAAYDAASLTLPANGHDPAASVALGGRKYDRIGRCPRRPAAIEVEVAGASWRVTNPSKVCFHQRRDGDLVRYYLAVAEPLLRRRRPATLMERYPDGAKGKASSKRVPADTPTRRGPRW